MNSLRGNAQLLQKLPVPKAVFPLATVISGRGQSAARPDPPVRCSCWSPAIRCRPSLLFLPVSILLAALFTLGAGLLLSPLAVFFSDVVELVGVLLDPADVPHPDLLPDEIVPERYRWVVRFNPLRSILEVFRDPIYYGKIPPLSHLGGRSAIALIALVLGAWLFRRSSDRIPFYI